MRIVVALIASLTMSACFSGETQPNKEAHPTANDAQNPVREIYCGSLVSSNQVAAYVASLHSRKSIAEGNDRKNLFAANVTLIEHGKSLHVSRDQIEGFGGALPSEKDWDAIASAIQRGKLKSGGWRGCFIAKGKAAFVADASGNFGLSAFDFDRPWTDL